MPDQANVTKEELLIIIRKHCMDCCANQRALVRACKSRSCALYPYRMKDTPTEPASSKRACRIQLSFDDLQRSDES